MWSRDLPRAAVYGAEQQCTHTDVGNLIESLEYKALRAFIWQIVELLGMRDRPLFEIVVAPWQVRTQYWFNNAILAAITRTSK